MNKKPLFSIIIPHSNQVDTCIETVKSLLFCNIFKNSEIIIIDSATNSDNFFFLLNSLQELNSNIIRIYRNSLSLFPGGARNFGSLKSTGKYLVFIDSDMEWSSKSGHFFKLHFLNSFAFQTGSDSYIQDENAS